MSRGHVVNITVTTEDGIVLDEDTIRVDPDVTELAIVPAMDHPHAIGQVVIGKQREDDLRGRVGKNKRSRMMRNTDATKEKV